MLFMVSHQGLFTLYIGMQHITKKDILVLKNYIIKMRGNLLFLQNTAEPKVLQLILHNKTTSVTCKSGSLFLSTVCPCKRSRVYCSNQSVIFL